MPPESMTSLHDIRRFLLSHGHNPQPWASSDEALDMLYQILGAREDDDAFWADLARLVGRLEDRQAKPLRLVGAEVLNPDAADVLVHQLRAGLRRAGPLPAGRKAFARSCRTLTPLAGFMLLGMAVACNDSEKDQEKESEELCQEAQDQSLSQDDGQIYCDLIDMIDAADLSDNERERLLDCLPDMSVSEWEELLSDWAGMGDTGVEWEMEAMAWSDWSSRTQSVH